MRFHFKRIVLVSFIFFFLYTVALLLRVLTDIYPPDGNNIALQKGDNASLRISRHVMPVKKPACKIPQLDPFDADAMKHIKDVDKLECQKKYFSRLDDQTLVVQIDNVLGVYYEYITRPENDDDHVKHSGRVILTKEERVKPYRGAVGCLFDHDRGSVYADTKSKKILFKSSKEFTACDPDNFWYLNPLGGIENLLDRYCLVVDNLCTSEAGCDLSMSPCKGKENRFEIKEDGSIMHLKTKKYLAIRTEGKYQVNSGLTLVEKEAAGKWLMVESKLQSINVRHKVTGDFIRVAIIKDRKMYVEYHATIIEKKSVRERAKNAKLTSNLPYNVAFLMVDSQSASNVKRRMPKSYAYLKEDKDTFIFEGHTIVGDGTTAQLSAIFAGGFEWDFPESRRGFTNAKPIDSWPFLFGEFMKRGYVTLYDEDEPVYGTFNYRLLGFEKPPTDHYTRPFWLGSEGEGFASGICHGDNPIYIRGFDFIKNLHNRYKGTPKLSLTVLSAMFHDNLSKAKNLDDDLLTFFKSLKDKGTLNDTILVLFGDHGARFEGFRETLTGKLEERLPFLSVSVPPKLIKWDQNLKKAMLHNTKVLTSHFDLHATLKHMFTYPVHPNVSAGQSLFSTIDQSTRTCGTAGIKDHWCPCLQFSELNTTNSDVIKMAEAVVTYINEEIIGGVEMAVKKCEILTLREVKRAGRRLPSDVIQRFKQTGQTMKCIECDVFLERDPNSNQNIKDYELVISVSPSDATFEASVKVANDNIKVQPSISRLNRYGNQPKCIQDKYPSLRKYCKCKPTRVLDQAVF
ncbi:uncharacterized protein LOC135691212 [Rhopilema esculentum]|uniref:uncharacterized protein LOC135691212 n=1 Tax=Rhopilema esculentum TaxID=499914 RepID=UPI0031DB0819|eukprot:gene1690-16167_t